MKGSLTKNYKESIVVEDEALVLILELIKKGFGDVYFEIKTVDGASYKLNSLEDVFNYTNPSARRIIKISIIGNKVCETPQFQPDFMVSLFDSSKYDASCVLSLNDLEEQEIVYYSQRIDELIKSMRVSYWWIHKPVVYGIIGVVLFLLFGALYFFNTEHGHNASSGDKILFLTNLSFLCGFFSSFVLKRIIEYLFPEGGFSIGEQKKVLNQKGKTRVFWLITIVATLILGIVSGLIVNWVAS